MLTRKLTQLCFVIAIQAALGNKCQDENSPITNNCFSCICEQATNCDVYSGCRAKGFKGGPWCGPMGIGMSFWIEYGNCTLDGDDPKDPICKCQKCNTFQYRIDRSHCFVAMERCTTDLACTMKVMRSFANSPDLPDCDEDGRITCDDYSMVHFLGNVGCLLPENRARYKSDKVYERYTACKNIVLSLGQEIDLPK